MNQDQDKKMQNQNQGKQGQTGQQTGQGGGNKPQSGNQPKMDERGNPGTTERIQPEPNRGQRQEGDIKPTGSQQPKL